MQTYYVSAWVRINSQQQAATWGGIRVLVTDLNWNEVSSIVLTPATSPIGQWTQVQFSFVAAGTLSRLHAGPFTDGQYTVSLDDFVVSTAAGTTPTPTSTSAATPTATPTSGGLPAPWQYISIGAVGAQGSAAYAGGVFTLSSASGDIWTQQDSFRFAYQSWSGDGTLVARIASLTATDGWAQAGLLFRESLNADARFGGIFATAQNGVQMLQRSSTGGSVTDIWPNDGQGQPVWLKLVRQGNVMRGYKSSDGATWTQIGSVTVAMNSTLYVGLAVTSQVLDTPATAVVDNVTLSTSVGTWGGAKGLAKIAVHRSAQQGGGATSTRNYYFFNGQRIAMRQCSVTCSGTTPGTVTWLHSDPLGSATLATDAGGQPLAGSETRYAPFGSVRFGGSGLPHDRRFNGNSTDIAGLLDFGARAYDPVIGRFVSADTIVPNPADPQTFNRYSYGLSNPLRYTDPSGHVPSESEGHQQQNQAYQNARGYFWNGSSYEFRQGKAYFTNLDVLNNFLVEAGFAKVDVLDSLTALLGRTVADIAHAVGGANQLATLLGNKPIDFDVVGVSQKDYNKVEGFSSGLVYVAVDGQGNIFNEVDARSVIAHEIGHLINYRTNFKPQNIGQGIGAIFSPRLQSWLPINPLSTDPNYSNGTDPRDEYFARAFAGWIYGKGTASDSVSSEQIQFFNEQLTVKKQ